MFSALITLFFYLLYFILFFVKKIIRKTGSVRGVSFFFLEVLFYFVLKENSANVDQFS